MRGGISIGDLLRPGQIVKEVRATKEAVYDDAGKDHLYDRITIQWIIGEPDVKIEAPKAQE